MKTTSVDDCGNGQLKIVVVRYSWLQFVGCRESPTKKNGLASEKIWLELTTLIKIRPLNFLFRKNATSYVDTSAPPATISFSRPSVQVVFSKSLMKSSVRSS